MRASSIGHLTGVQLPYGIHLIGVRLGLLRTLGFNSHAAAAAHEALSRARWADVSLAQPTWDQGLVGEVDEAVLEPEEAIEELVVEVIIVVLV